MKKYPKINFIGSIGEDIKESINDFIYVVEKIKLDVEELKKEVKALKKKKMKANKLL